MIQRKTVRSDPPADMHADSGHFLAIYPDAGAARNSPGCNIELRERIHDHLFDSANIGHHVALPFSQIHDRIADNLTRSVISDVTAAVGGIELDAGAAQRA